MLQVLLENLTFMCKSALVWGIDYAQPNCNPIWNPDKCWKSGEYDIGRASHYISHVISWGLSIMNFHDDAGIERESIQASSYLHSTVHHIQDNQ